eukprot:4509029-Pleurochrysis_carterae.AAC.1
MAIASRGCAGAMGFPQRLRGCDGLAHGWVSAHVDLVAAVVDPHSVCACIRRNDAKEVRLPVVRGRTQTFSAGRTQTFSASVVTAFTFASPGESAESLS